MLSAVDVGQLNLSYVLFFLLFVLLLPLLIDLPLPLAIFLHPCFVCILMGLLFFSSPLDFVGEIGVLLGNFDLFFKPGVFVLETLDAVFKHLGLAILGKGLVNGLTSMAFCFIKSFS